MDKLYTVKQAAEILNLAEGTIRNNLTSGKIKFVKVLGATRIEESELKRIIQAVDKK